jgi:hypothetical protein
MKRVLLALGTMAVVAASGALLACNGLLGIGVASQEAEDSGTGAEAGQDGGLCGTYCALMDKNCNWNTSNFGEYINIDVCNAMCPVFDMGEGVKPSNDDTLGCRVFYAQKAAADPAKFCSAAGLLGGGVCGVTPCTEFCGADVPYCASAAVNSASYMSVDDCIADCAPPDGGLGYPYVKEDGGDISGIEQGNTLNCRTWHLNNAYLSTTNGQAHCRHTQLDSTPCAGTRPDSGLIVP